MSPLFVSGLTRSLATGPLLAVAIGFSGCAHTYNVKVDALCNPSVTAGASYRIVPKDAVKADFEPQFAHAVQLIETALASRGYFSATTIRDADLVIEVDFGVGSRRRSASEDIDLFGPPKPTTTSAATMAPPSSRLSAPQLLAAPDVAEEPPATRVTVITLYEKFLSLSARETPQATRGRRKPVELWRVTVSVEDRESTVDACLPVLVVTATDNIGQSTDARTNIRVSDKAPTAVLANNDR